jgi:putative flavoprotein involved in K+ transport
MPTTSVVIVGAGHCGLAMSRCLAARSVDHVVLERGEVAHSWRTQRWDSLRLLTPNWMTRLPGFAYRGDDPDGYLPARDVVRLVEEYAEVSAAPVLTGTTVTGVRTAGPGFVVDTDRGRWRTRAVVVATGAATVPSVPSRLADQLPAGTTATHVADYRNPERLPRGEVLVVGASASGIQIAEEIQSSGRPVTLAVGEHVRMPRTYRGRDIMWWLDASGVLDERYDAVDDLTRVRHLPSMQLVGSRPQATIGLNELRRSGVRVVGRFAGVRDGAAQFSGSLPNVCSLADLKLTRLLDLLDRWADRTGVDAECSEPFAPTSLPDVVPLSAPLGAGAIETVVWATGFRPNLSFLGPDVFDRRGRIVHDGGVTDRPGLYVMGLPFLRRRRSTLIDGAAADARDLAAHLMSHLDAVAARRAS